MPCCWEPLRCWELEESLGEAAASVGDAAEDDVEKAELLFEAVDEVPSLCLTPPEALAPPGHVPPAAAEVLSMLTPGLMSRELLLHRLEPAVS